MRNPCILDNKISLIEGIPQSELFEREMNELIDILNQLKDSTKYPILSQAIILSPLLTNTYLSYQKLKSGLNLKEIAQLQNVKLNTIEDHILEMYIKGYLIDYTLFINKKRYSRIYKLLSKTSRLTIKIL